MRAPAQLHEDPAAFLQARLEEIPSVFARLVLLADKAHARLWQPIYPAAQSAPPDPKILQGLPTRAFQQWLAMPTKHKIKDMTTYLDCLGSAKIPKPSDFLPFCRTLIPRAASEAEADHFLGTVKFVLEVLSAQRQLQ